MTAVSSQGVELLAAHGTSLLSHSSVEMCAGGKSPTCAACGAQIQVFFLSSGLCLKAKSLFLFHAYNIPDQRQITVHLMVRIMQF